jgi:transcriptional regulator with XRE-family HTH domain
VSHDSVEPEYSNRKLTEGVETVESSRIGSTLKAARTRLGWSREALAFHSGVSWSAIAQIESGRRKDVHLSSLSALANALGVSVDYLIGTAAASTPPQLFEHRVLLYETDDEFVATAAPFLEEGIDQSHCLLAVATPPKTSLLRDALGTRSEQVTFGDWDEWYRSPQESLRRYGEFVKQKLEAGAVWIRIVGEAAWTDDTDGGLTQWIRYESLVNLAFATSPITIVCTYDERSVSPALLAEAHQTHPELAHGIESTPSPSYRDPVDFLLHAR